MTVAEKVAASRIVVCVGSGGVGKTTVAAALGLRAALDGRRAMVLTIDPARRLAEALGLEGLAPGGEDISSQRLEEAGLHVRAPLSAGMLDQPSAWDAFIERHSPSREVRETILANPFYQSLSRSFAGSTEYMAMEELGRINETGDYDLIVLDTPPSRHALEFLEAPRRLEDFFDRSVLGWLARPTSAGWSVWKTASRGARFVFERIEEATGLAALTEIGAFFAAIEALVDGVTQRSRTVRALLHSPTTTFILVTGAEEQILEDAEALARGMQDLHVSLGGVVMNRTLDVATGALEQESPNSGQAEDAKSERNNQRGGFEEIRRCLMEAGVAEPVVEWIETTARSRAMQAGARAVRREAFEAGLPADVPVVAIPEQRRDVHDLRGLASIADALLG